ncbi:CAP domain-containing protein [Aeromicrobium sp. Root344]|uniref:CAP domain-containing protein n=1 Tax=Aeromicrobium sp. Root344 TaxID=1736521 RepID=UPI0009E7853A|nr:CAP domain-containing protein [Aeromicrobium sp. Root344]
MKKILNPRALAGAVAMVLLVLASAPASAVTSTTYESDVIKWTNVKRVDRDKVAVKSQSCVDRYAEKQAAWMASHGELKHQSMSTILNACGLSLVSENIAYGYGTGGRVVSAWMRSPGHRANLLNSKVRWIGVGAVQDDDGVWWVSQVFGRKQ